MSENSPVRLRQEAEVRILPLRILAAIGNPVVIVLALAATGETLTGNPIHGAFLFSVAAVLAWDLERGRPSGAGRDLPRVPILALVGAGLAYAILVGRFARYSWPDTVSVVIPGAVAIVLAWRTRPHYRAERDRVNRTGAILWAVVFIGFGLWELGALLAEPTLTISSYAHPTLSDLASQVFRWHSVRSVAMFAWLAFGWWLLER